LRFLQAGALSPTKLRMKIMGAHNRVRVITSNSSSRTSPAKNIEASQAQNRLLVCDVLEEGTAKDAAKDAAGYSIVFFYQLINYGIMMACQCHFSSFLLLNFLRTIAF
jgi:hypothetical protein